MTDEEFGKMTLIALKTTGLVWIRNNILRLAKSEPVPAAAWGFIDAVRDQLSKSQSEVKWLADLDAVVNQPSLAVERSIAAEATIERLQEGMADGGSRYRGEQNKRQQADHRHEK